MKKVWLLIITLVTIGVTTLTSVPVVKASSQTQIEVQINGRQRLRATLNNSSAARQFARELPKTMHFRNYMSGYEEKIADLHHPLSTRGMPKGNNAKTGEIGYWSPDQRIVFYWGNESYYEGIHIIGHFKQETNLRPIRHLKSNDQVTIKRVND